MHDNVKASYKTAKKILAEEGYNLESFSEAGEILEGQGYKMSRHTYARDMYEVAIATSENKITPLHSLGSFFKITEDETTVHFVAFAAHENIDNIYVAGFSVPFSDVKNSRLAKVTEPLPSVKLEEFVNKIAVQSADQFFASLAPKHPTVSNQKARYDLKS